jgi:PKD repeat protein
MNAHHAILAEILQRPQKALVAAVALAALVGAAPSQAPAGERLDILRSGGSPQTSVTLSWTAVGDDDSIGTASIYDMRYATSLLSEENWALATQVSGEPLPQVAGEQETLTVAGLTPGTTYYFALKVADEVPNWSGMSNVHEATTLPLPPIALFEASPTSGAAPLTVDFTDLSENVPTSWLWSFGDGGISTAQNPAHTYTEVGSYTVTLVAFNDGGSDTLSHANYIDVTPESRVLVHCDIDVLGARTGTYLATHVSDGVYEVIEEEESRGNPKNRHSHMEHKWLIDVAPGNQITLHLEAHHSANAEGDDFILAYSVDDVQYTDLLTVTKTDDDDTYQSAPLPPSTRGPVYLRMEDTDRTPRNLSLDQIFVDHLYVESVTIPDSVPPIISDLSVSDITQSSATITWTTDEYSTSTVHYDTDGGPAYDFTVSSGDLVLEHCILLDDLSAATAYHFIVESTDESDNMAASSQHEFVTTSGEQEMFVADIEMSLTISGPLARGAAAVLVTALGGGPLEGATVSAHWTGLTTDTEMSTTGPDGLVSLASDKIRDAEGWFIITVDEVVKEGWTYNPEANVEMCDSVYIAPGIPLNQATQDLARAVTLHGCYPNPAAAAASIRFDLPAECRTTLQIFDITGRPVHTLIDSRVQPAGRHLIVWDRRTAHATRLSSGVYFIQLRAGDVTAQTRLALLD